MRHTWGSSFPVLPARENISHAARCCTRKLPKQPSIPLPRLARFFLPPYSLLSCAKYFIITYSLPVLLSSSILHGCPHCQRVCSSSPRLQWTFFLSHRASHLFLLAPWKSCLCAADRGKPREAKKGRLRRRQMASCSAAVYIFVALARTCVRRAIFQTTFPFPPSQHACLSKF